VTREIINDEVKVIEARVIGDDNSQLGVISKNKLKVVAIRQDY
jgi:translation initiation factor IF-3